ncbi:5240_t:CDS:1, partial [Entrophospora sp. SA101]
DGRIWTSLESYYQNKLSAPVAGSQSGKHTMRIKQDMKEIDKQSDCVCLQPPTFCDVD